MTDGWVFPALQAGLAVDVLIFIDWNLPNGIEIVYSTWRLDTPGNRLRQRQRLLAACEILKRPPLVMLGSTC